MQKKHVRDSNSFHGTNTQQIKTVLPYINTEDLGKPCSHIYLLTKIWMSPI